MSAERTIVIIGGSLAGGRAAETLRTEGFDGLRGRPSGGDHVLDQADAIARLEGAFEPIAGAIVLRRLVAGWERWSNPAKISRGNERCGRSGLRQAGA